MNNPWNMINPDIIKIVDPNGNERCSVKAYYAGNTIIVDDTEAQFEPGDEILRPLPNGHCETLIVDDSKFYNIDGVSPHYQIKFHKPTRSALKEELSAISITGTNARVNINSTDNSHNYASDNTLFRQMRDAVKSELHQNPDLENILHAINNAQERQCTPEFKTAYQELIASLANHATILTPFLPALSKML